MTMLAVLILSGVALVFAVLIALANRRLWVWEDPRIDVVSSLLPNANCGACGLPGCRAFAEQAVEGLVQPSQCTVGTDESHKAIAGFLGRGRGNSGTASRPPAVCRGATTWPERWPSTAGSRPAPRPLPWPVVAKGAPGDASASPTASGSVTSTRSP